MAPLPRGGWMEVWTHRDTRLLSLSCRWSVSSLCVCGWSHSASSFPCQPTTWSCRHWGERTRKAWVSGILVLLTWVELWKIEEAGPCLVVSTSCGVSARIRFDITLRNVTVSKIGGNWTDDHSHQQCLRISHSPHNSAKTTFWMWEILFMCRWRCQKGSQEKRLSCSVWCHGKQDRLFSTSKQIIKVILTVTSTHLYSLSPLYIIYISLSLFHGHQELILATL